MSFQVSSTPDKVNTDPLKNSSFKPAKDNKSETNKEEKQTIDVRIYSINGMLTAIYFE